MYFVVSNNAIDLPISASPDIADGFRSLHYLALKIGLEQPSTCLLLIELVQEGFGELGYE